jgi:glycine C-acetyltransferase
MPISRLNRVLASELERLDDAGVAKRHEQVVTAIVDADGAHGPRVLLEGEGDKPFLRMNSNGYLGMSRRPEVIAAEEEAVARLGAGPGAVRFISGTYAEHVALEAKLAAFHGREAAMIFSSAYATQLGVLVPLLTAESAVVSDELNHNCIINAIRLSRPKDKRVYKHLDYAALDAALGELAGTCRRVVVVTDGIFSMRGDWAELDRVMEIAARHDAKFPENVVVVADDSHGVGAFGATGRGTEEHCNCQVDLLVGTLGKAFGVNGGYVVGPRVTIDFLRETAATYIYSNPIAAGEAAAALAAVELLDSPVGAELLAHLRAMTERFEAGLVRLGFETIPGSHPVVPLVVRNTQRTRALVQHLSHHGVLATGLAYPVVPRGEDEIRFQVSADHTVADIDLVLDILGQFEG